MKFILADPALLVDDVGPQTNVIEEHHCQNCFPCAPDPKQLRDIHEGQPTSVQDVALDNLLSADIEHPNLDVAEQVSSPPGELNGSVTKLHTYLYKFHEIFERAKQLAQCGTALDPYPNRAWFVDEKGPVYVTEAITEHCRAGWLTVCTTVLCSQFNSPSLSPSVPYHYPQACCTIIRSHHIVLDRITLHWVASHCVTSHQVASHCITSGHITLGQVTSHWVRLHRIASGCVALHRVASVVLLLGQLHHYWPYLVRYPSLLWFPFLHALFLLFLQRFSLYLHFSLFSFYHCDPGHLSLTLALPYPCHLSLRYF